MRGFLREHWMWIVGSVLLMVVAVVIVLVIGGGKDTSPFQYSEF